MKVWEGGEARAPKSESQVPTLRLAAALASHSAHPISQAVARLSTDRLELTNWQEIRGAGVQASVGANYQSPFANRHSPIILGFPAAGKTGDIK